jgi:hypothetical protein
MIEVQRVKMTIPFQIAMKKAPTLEKTQNDLQGVAVFSDGVGSEDVGVACERLRVACERLKNTRHVSLKERLGKAVLFFASGTLAIVDTESVDAASSMELAAILGTRSYTGWITSSVFGFSPRERTISSSIRAFDKVASRYAFSSGLHLSRKLEMVGITVM